jgi:hypothetical protein
MVTKQDKNVKSLTFIHKIEDFEVFKYIISEEGGLRPSYGPMIMQWNL